MPKKKEIGDKENWIPIMISKALIELGQRFRDKQCFMDPPSQNIVRLEWLTCRDQLWSSDYKKGDNDRDGGEEQSRD
ncbi:hypothetical protein TNCV_1124001 [Trichonephila clavipes]|uniref:Uncharacterized protein n=1 Tax=Trichonephila clavipes TaxID=2585209 RepID=A0A8X6SPZ5_TRICX|nr:hypothetical protein TNCV_1124001 [Trichonephila clavipes]